MYYVNYSEIQAVVTFFHDIPFPLATLSAGETTVADKMISKKFLESSAAFETFLPVREH